MTIRYLDPPLHEFLPTKDEDIKELAADMGMTFEDPVSYTHLDVYKRQPEGRMRSLPGFWVMSSHRTMTWSAGILKKPASGAMESPERFM